MSASTLPTMVPTHSWWMGTSFWITEAMVTPGGGGGGFSSLEEQPKRLTSKRSDAPKDLEIGGKLRQMANLPELVSGFISFFNRNGMRFITCTLIPSPPAGRQASSVDGGLTLTVVLQK